MSEEEEEDDDDDEDCQRLKTAIQSSSLQSEILS